jgi:acyl-CoA thioesterase-1
MADTVTQADTLERRFGESERIVAAGELQRQRHVLVGRHRGNEVESLEDDTDMVAPQPRAVVVAQWAKIPSSHLDSSGSGAFEAARHHHQARLAGAGRPDDRRNLAGCDVESDATQDIDRAGIACHVEMDVGQPDNWLTDDGMRLGHTGSWDGLMKLQSGYGGFAATVKSRIAAVAAVHLALLLCFVAPLASAQTTPAQPAPAGTSAVKLAVLGDSLTAGYGLSPAQSFPTRLGEALKAQGRNVTVINHGVSGDTTAGGLERIDWMLGDKPDIVLVELGANDALRAIDPASTEHNLDAIITRLKQAGVTVWLAGMLAPRNFGPEYARQFDGIYKKLADKHGVPLYPFFLDGVAQERALNQADGIHPNAKGVDVVVDRILPFVTKNLDSYATSVRRPARP